MYSSFKTFACVFFLEYEVWDVVADERDTSDIAEFNWINLQNNLS